MHAAWDNPYIIVRLRFRLCRTTLSSLSSLPWLPLWPLASPLPWTQRRVLLVLWEEQLWMTSLCWFAGPFRRRL